MIEQHFLQVSLLAFRKLKSSADKAIAQVEPERIFTALGPEENSIALIMKHLAGNMLSRWTDFLISDGEKPNRDRDGEFILEDGDSHAEILAAWEEGWSAVFSAVSSLTPEDLEKVVQIRGKDYTVLNAITRQTTHYAGHVGQIILLAKHYAGSSWQTLTIPRGMSKEFHAARRSGR